VPTTYGPAFAGSTIVGESASFPAGCDWPPEQAEANDAKTPSSTGQSRMPDEMYHDGLELGATERETVDEGARAG
jgi:hypothetical protein